MSTFKVIEVFEISNVAILVCDLFDNSVITDTSITDVGSFNKDEFAGNPQLFVLANRSKD